MLETDRVLSITKGVLKEYRPASSLGGNDNFPVAIIEQTDSEGNVSQAWIPDSQNIKYGTEVVLARIETPVGKGSHIETVITPIERADLSSIFD